MLFKVKQKKQKLNKIFFLKNLGLLKKLEKSCLVSVALKLVTLAFKIYNDS